MAITDPVPGNNSATDTDALIPRADLSITKDDGVASVVAGSTVAYTVTVANTGPSTAVGAHVVDTVPSTLSDATWTCVGSSGGVCATGSGVGSIDTTVDLPVGGVATFTLTATLSASATGSLVNTATVDAAAGTIDPVPGNDSATDTDTVVVSSDLSVMKSDGDDHRRSGDACQLHDHGHQRRAVERHRGSRRGCASGDTDRGRVVVRCRRAERL